MLAIQFWKQCQDVCRKHARYVFGLRTGEVAMVNINESVKREVSGKQKPLRDLDAVCGNPIVIFSKVQTGQISD